MRVSSILRTATLVLSLMAAMGTLSACIDGGKPAATQQQKQQQTPNTGSYNNPDFVPPNLLYD
jgi:hypothetical protein